MTKRSQRKQKDLADLLRTYTTSGRLGCLNLEMDDEGRKVTYIIFASVESGGQVLQTKLTSLVKALSKPIKRRVELIVERGGDR